MKDISRDLPRSPRTTISGDAVLAWMSMLRRAFTETVPTNQIIVPVVAYASAEEGNGGSKRMFCAPLVVKAGGVEEDIIEDYLLESLPGREDDMDLALSSTVLLVSHEAGIVTRRLDIIDVDPGATVVHPADLKPEKYTALKTRNAFHLYPKTDVFGDNGGRLIIDPKWSRGFLRVTQSEAKGRITKVRT